MPVFQVLSFTIFIFFLFNIVLSNSTLDVTFHVSVDPDPKGNCSLTQPCSFDTAWTKLKSFGNNIENVQFSFHEGIFDFSTNFYTLNVSKTCNSIIFASYMNNDVIFTTDKVPEDIGNAQQSPVFVFNDYSDVAGGRIDIFVIGIKITKFSRIFMNNNDNGLRSFGLRMRNAEFVNIESENLILNSIEFFSLENVIVKHIKIEGAIHEVRSFWKISTANTNVHDMIVLINRCYFDTGTFSSQSSFINIIENSMELNSFNVNITNSVLNRMKKISFSSNAQMSYFLLQNNSARGIPDHDYFIEFSMLKEGSIVDIEISHNKGDRIEHTEESFDSPIMFTSRGDMNVNMHNNVFHKYPMIPSFLMNSVEKNRNFIMVYNWNFISGLNHGFNFHSSKELKSSFKTTSGDLSTIRDAILEEPLFNFNFFGDIFIIADHIHISNIHLHTTPPNDIKTCQGIFHFNSFTNVNFTAERLQLYSSSSAYGGAFCFQSEFAKSITFEIIEQSKFYDVVASNHNEPKLIHRGMGGVVHIERLNLNTKANVIFSGVEFLFCNAGYAGGVISTWSEIDKERTEKWCTITIKKCDFEQGKSFYGNGGVFDIYNSDIKIYESTFLKNVVENNMNGKGGVINSINSNVNIKIKNYFDSSQAVFGAVFFSENDVIKIDSSNVFTKNIALIGGGIMYLKETFLFYENSILEGGKARYGGALFVDNFNSRVRINNQVTNNEAMSGGGMYVASDISPVNFEGLDRIKGNNQKDGNVIGVPYRIDVKSEKGSKCIKQLFSYKYKCDIPMSLLDFFDQFDNLMSYPSYSTYSFVVKFEFKYVEIISRNFGNYSFEFESSEVLTDPLVAQVIFGTHSKDIEFTLIQTKIADYENLLILIISLLIACGILGCVIIAILILGMIFYQLIKSGKISLSPSMRNFSPLDVDDEEEKVEYREMSISNKKGSSDETEKLFKL